MADALSYASVLCLFLFIVYPICIGTRGDHQSDTHLITDCERIQFISVQGVQSGSFQLIEQRLQFLGQFLLKRFFHFILFPKRYCMGSALFVLYLERIVFSSV